MIFQMAYVSNVAQGVSVQDCQEIAARSEVNNARDGVTGCLMLYDGWFVQVLEGAVGAVNRIYARIIADQRHVYPTILGADFIHARNFPVWRMRLVHIQNSERVTHVIRRYNASTAFDPMALDRLGCVAMLCELISLEDPEGVKAPCGLRC